jgi:predicted transcriptional regulator
MTAAPLTADELDSRIEAWLRQTFGVEIDFAVNGAPGKRGGLSRLRRQQERLFVSPRDGAIAQLRAVAD